MKPANRIRATALAPLVALAALALAAGCARKTAPKNESLPPQVSQLLRGTVQNRALPVALKDQQELQRAWRDLQSFYEQRGYQPAWSTSHGPRPQATELIQAIPPLAVDGLDVRRYQPERL